MKFNSANYSATALGVLLALSGAEIQAGAMGPVQVPASEKVYFSVFGGGGASNQVNVSQYGTAFFLEPLAVDAFGQTNSRSVGMVGGHVGYQWSDLFFNALNRQVNLTPAVELEGYYVGKNSFSGQEVNNETTRLLAHDFLVTYPISTGVFLANTVLNFNSANYARWRPYVGAGIGAAVLSISNADSTQTAPLELNVNHYNSNPNDKTASFAAQIKTGLNFALNDRFSVFAEYRWLYIADSDFTFGSTVYTGHPVTSSWNVNLGSQYYNLGAAGIRFTI